MTNDILYGLSVAEERLASNRIARNLSVTYDYTCERNILLFHVIRIQFSKTRLPWRNPDSNFNFENITPEYDKSIYTRIQAVIYLDVNEARKILDSKLNASCSGLSHINVQSSGLVTIACSLSSRIRPLCCQHICAARGAITRYA